MTAIGLRTDTRQQQTLSPQLQRAVRLLQLSSLDFAQEVRDVLGRNPFLEAEEGDADSPADEGQEVADPDGAEAQAPADEHRLDDVGLDLGERDTWQSDGSNNPRRSDDGDTSWMDRIADSTSLAAHLHTQLNVLRLDARDAALAKAVVESLDDDGYLRVDLAEVVAGFELDPPPAEDELAIALKRVQALEPAGIAARSVAECLLLQLPAIACPGERALAQEIVTHHVDALAAKDVNGLARALSCTPATIEKICDRIRRLDPRPGWAFGAADVRYVTPDVIVRKVRGEWTVRLNPAIAPRVRLNHVYEEMFQRHRARHNEPQHNELAAHLQQARWTVRNIEQRFATILGVAQEIVRRQKHFFDYGTLAMKPMALREVADQVGVHESTVSRVTNNKYMATPLGVFELKYFFSRAMTARSGSEFSGTAIRGLVKDMIDAERPEDPLSDAEIARRLARQGLAVARRTVTKYRQLMRIEAVERRRRHD